MLQIENLSVKYGEKRVLDNLSCEFPTGALSFIIGTNGCGKTTLLRSIEGLIKSEGNITVDGKDLKTMPIKDKAKIITYLPQNRPVPNIDGALMIEHGRFPHLGFYKNLGEEDKIAIDKAVELTNTSSLLDKSLAKMSGGEQQRIYIATALAQETDILLLDEPTSHLDLVNQMETLALLKRLKDAGKTVIVVLHDLEQAFTFGDYIYLVKDGKIVDIGTPDEVCASENLVAAFGYGLTPDTADGALYKFKLTNKGDIKEPEI